MTQLDRSPMLPRPPIPVGVLTGGVVAIARRLPAADVAAVADALLHGGVLAFELTLNEPQDAALRSVEAAARHVAGAPLAIGAGTVLDQAAARRAIDAGATFLVMPHTDVDLVAWAAAQGIAAFPGAATPTEVLAAWRAGASGVKVFPASGLGPTFLRELHGPFPDIPFVPSGGIGLADIPAFIGAGAVAIGMGSWLTGGVDVGEVAGRARQAVEAVARARAELPMSSAGTR